MGERERERERERETEIGTKAKIVIKRKIRIEKLIMRKKQLVFLISSFIHQHASFIHSSSTDRVLLPILLPKISSTMRGLD